MKFGVLSVVSVCIVLLVPCRGIVRSQVGSDELTVVSPSGLGMRVAKEHSDPTLWLDVPGEASGENAVLVLLPEHVTVRRHGTSDAQHLYLWRPGDQATRRHWVRIGDTLQYESDLGSGLHFLARASARSDGVLLHYEFANSSDVDFDSVQAVTDPRMVSALFHDVRLERTYVHERGRFALLASDMPQRINMPIDIWLPNRYRISYSWPAERVRAQKQPDGVTFFNAQDRADEPFLATVSADSKWILATFSRNPGNLWTNPDLTCQHADPEISLTRHSKGIAEEKILLFRGTLEDVLSKVKAQRGDLK